MCMKRILEKLFKHEKEEFADAVKAYQRSTYSKEYTREELTGKLIDELKRSITRDCKNYQRTYMNISTYSGYREKQVLPEVARYFESKKYKVVLHNEEAFQDINVLIINWQHLEDFT